MDNLAEFEENFVIVDEDENINKQENLERQNDFQNK